MKPRRRSLLEEYGLRTRLREGRSLTTTGRSCAADGPCNDEPAEVVTRRSREITER
jgi:hypothetical protein